MSDAPPGRSAHASACAIPLAAVLVAVSMLAAACGKKAPPRPPILYLPASPTVTGQEQGHTAQIQVQIPTANTNGSTPAVLDRVLVYGYTGTPDLTDEEAFLKKATLVASVPVAPAPKPGSDEAEEQEEQEKPATPPPPPSKFPAQGATFSVREAITPAIATPVPVDDESKKKDDGDVELPSMAVPLAGAPEEVPTRGYYVLGITSRNRRGPIARAVTVPLVPPPAAPGAPVVSFNESAITIKWSAPPLVRQPVQQGAAPVVPAASELAPIIPVTPGMTSGEPVAGAAGEAPSAPSAPPGEPPSASPREVPPASPRESGPVFTPGQAPVVGTVVPLVAPPLFLPSTPVGPTYAPTAYNLYEVDPKAPEAKKLIAEGSGEVVAGGLPKPINASPLSTTTYTDSRMTWGKRRCYEVRAVDTYGTMTIESEPSAMTCVELKDTFPPAAPHGLQAVGAEGAISLIWEPNTESDLAGYIVLRAEGTGALTPITPRPIRETTFRDTTVRPGQTYAYVVVAVDTARNHSAASNRVQETAR